MLCLLFSYTCLPSLRSWATTPFCFAWFILFPERTLTFLPNSPFTCANLSPPAPGFPESFRLGYLTWAWVFHLLTGPQSAPQPPGFPEGGGQFLVFFNPGAPIMALPLNSYPLPIFPEGTLDATTSRLPPVLQRFLFSRSSFPFFSDPTSLAVFFWFSPSSSFSICTLSFFRRPFRVSSSFLLSSVSFHLLP